jgi:membrane protease YdiL (CAAX protease family)
MLASPIVETATRAPAQGSSLRRAIARHPVAAFLIMVYTIAWTLFLPSFLGTDGIGVLPVALPLMAFTLPAAILGITLPGFIVTRIAEGREGTRDLRRRYLRWRVAFGWYPLVLLGPPLAMVFAATLWRGGAPLHALGDHWSLILTTSVPQALLIAALVSIWEEGGWTGFLLPRMQERWGVLRGAAIMNSCQALFHVPLIFIIGGVTDQRVHGAGYALYPLFLFIFVLPVRAIMTWLYNSTRGSLVIVALFHGAFNMTTTDKVIPQFVPGDSAWIFAVYAALGIVLVLATRGRLGYQQGRDRITPMEPGYRAAGERRDDAVSSRTIGPR